MSDGNEEVTTGEEAEVPAVRYTYLPPSGTEPVRLVLGEREVTIERMASGESETFELEPVRTVELIARPHSGRCVLRAQEDRTLEIPSISGSPSGEAINQARAYGRFVVALHERLQQLAPAATFVGSRPREMLVGRVTVGLSALLLALYALYFIVPTNLRVELYRWFYLTLPLAGLCGVLVGWAILRRGAPSSYSPVAIPAELLPMAEEVDAGPVSTARTPEQAEERDEE